jgi:sulfite exporter TauE/SafE
MSTTNGLQQALSAIQTKASLAELVGGQRNAKKKKKGVNRMFLVGVFWVVMPCSVVGVIFS